MRKPINLYSITMRKPNLNIKLGKDSKGNYFSYDIGKMEHLIIGGSSGEQKINFVHCILKQLIENNSSKEVKFIMTDICSYGRVHLDVYSKTNYLLAPVLTESEKVTEMLNWLDSEQSRRYELLKSTGIRTTDDYNEIIGEYALPKIVVIINDLANLVDEIPKFEKTLIKIMQLSKYSGINIILITQNYEKEVLTPLIKVSTGSRIAFKTEDSISSFLLLENPGAEKFEDKGELLFISPESLRPIKLHTDYISEKDLAEFIKSIRIDNPKYNEGLINAVNNYYLDIP